MGQQVFFCRRGELLVSPFFPCPSSPVAALSDFVLRRGAVASGGGEQIYMARAELSKIRNGKRAVRGEVGGARSLGASEGQTLRSVLTTPPCQVPYNALEVLLVEPRKARRNSTIGGS